MKHYRTPSILAAGLAMSLLIASCGDGGADTATPNTAAPSAEVTETTSTTTTTPSPSTTVPAVPSENDGPTSTGAPGSTEEDTSVSDPTDTTPPGGLELNPIKPQPVPGASVKIGVVEPALMPLAERAREDLAGRLSVAPSAIDIVTAESVVWPDGSMGCPQPDMAYLQVMSDGARILLVHDGATYSYHSGGNRDVFLCLQPTSPAAGGGGIGDS